MRLRAWTLSTSNDGARSPANQQCLDGLLRLGTLAVTPGMTISVDQKVEQGVPCARVLFHLPRAFGGSSIPVLVPATCVGTGRIQPSFIFYVLREEIIGWLAHIGPKNSLLRLYHHNQGQPLPRSDSLEWQQTHSGFITFISSLRSSNEFPGLRQMSGALGALEVAQTRTPAGDITADYIVTLTLNNRQRMSLSLPRSVAQLGTQWLLDWLEVQIEFSL